MKHLLNFLVEKLTISQAREYLGVKRDPVFQVWLDAFWERAKEYKGAKVSRNGYRIYLPFNVKLDIELGDQQDDYDGLSGKIKKRIEEYIKKNTKYNVSRIDYMHGKFYYIQDTQMGPKEREYSIGKAIKNDKELLLAYSSDPIRNIGSLDKKKLEIVLSNHAYDIAGMSTDRKWTSCMNIVDGPYKNWVKEDIKWGTIVAYLIESSDENIQNPLGRILIKPYLTNERTIYYYPEPTVYSPYVGLDSMKEYLDNMCLDIQGEIDELLKLVRNKENEYFKLEPYPKYKDSSMTNNYEDDNYPEDWNEDDIKYFKLQVRKQIANMEKKNDFLLYYDDAFAQNILRTKNERYS